MGDDEETPSGNESDKIAKLREVEDYLEKFDNFITEDAWKERFEVPLNVYIDQIADPNLKIFMEY